ncbi:hypothetical protein GCM10011507_18360 [Edaphobacter acidisoli]|uniref:Uncharacterized protein n=1 Tax=Edaphobacter acidisoli TaxID=2040573 RepID=A0A916W5D9_9BACT|nr:hypothetical protein [Edaphobacter acidisoli]GGA67153.1 hypothetical protein GCM10011507_18360 [Edaphobacter acidisoli]
MNRYHALVLAVALALPCAKAQQPRGITDAINNLADQPATRIEFSYDGSQLRSAEDSYLYGGNPHHAVALYGITVDTSHFSRPVFYTPEVMSQIINIYHAAGWQHLVNANLTPAQGTSPAAPVTDMWLHFNGAEIDDVTVLVRGEREMNLIQISCMLRPLDLLHLGGHFGIPRVDPNAVMVPAPNGK